MADVTYITAAPAQNIYAFVKDRLGNVLTFTNAAGVYTYAGAEAYNSAHWAQYAIPTIEHEPGVYYLTQPTGLPNGSYPIIAWQQVASGAFNPVVADGAAGPVGGDIEIWMGTQYVLESVPGPPSDTQTTGYSYTYDPSGNLVGGVSVIIELISPGIPGVFAQKMNVTSDGSGRLTAVLIKGASYSIQSQSGSPVFFVAGSANQYQMPSVMEG